MDDGLIKLIVVAVVLFLSFVSKSLEKKAQQQRRGGSTAPRRKTGLEALAELEKKLREAHRAAEAQARARQGGGAGASGADVPPVAAQRRAAAAREAAAPAFEETPDAPPPPITTSTTVAARHIETHVGGLETRHLQDSVENRHLDLDVVKAREGHAAILDARPETDLPIGPTVAARRAGGVRLPARLTELQRALVWTEVLGPPASAKHGL